MNRKGSYTTAVKSIFWIFVASFVALGIAFYFKAIVDVNVKYATDLPPKLEAEMIMLRFLNNPDCFAYQEEFSGRVFTQTIDLEKFTEKQMNNCYNTSKLGKWRIFNFLLKLEGKEIASNHWYETGGDPEYTFFEDVRVKTDQGWRKSILTTYANRINVK